jgi:hypothetical protein
VQDPPAQDLHNNNNNKSFNLQLKVTSRAQENFGGLQAHINVKIKQWTL